MAGTTTTSWVSERPGTSCMDTTIQYNKLVDDLETLRAARAVLTGSGTTDVASLADGAGATHTITVTGAALGDFALVSAGVDLQGITVTAYVSAANTVSVRVQNESGGVIDLASTTWRALVFPRTTFIAVAAAALTAAKVGQHAGTAITA